MELTNNYLISSDANYFFSESFSFPGDKILKIALRYIALKCCNADLDKLTPISVRYDHSLFNTAHLDLTDDSCLIYMYNRLSVEEEQLYDCGFLKLQYEKAKPLATISPTSLFMSEHLSRISPTSLYINEEKKKVIVIVDQITEKWITEFSSILFRILIWFYPNEKLSDEEQRFFRSISKRDSETLNCISNSYANLVDFAATCRRLQKEQLRQQLVGWGNDAYKALIVSLEDSVKKSSTELERLRAEFTKTLDELNLNNAQLSALISVSPKDNNSVFEFFEMNKQLNLIKVINSSSGKHFYYSINETIEYYDVDKYLEQYKNKTSYLYSYVQEIQDLMYGLIAQGKGNLKTRCVFKMTGLTSLTPEKNYDFGDKKILPHPHIDMGICLGNNGPKILAYLQSNNWEMAITQTIAAAKNIYFADVGVIQRMMNWLQANLHSKDKYIIADNGCEMSINEFLKYIKEADNEKAGN